MSTLDFDVEQDPAGFTPRPDLFVRNLSPNTITFNMGEIRWELPPWPNPDYEQKLPWTVAVSSGFQRLWEREKVLVAADADFVLILTELPATGGTGSGAYVHHQETPAAVVNIVHNFNRQGPVLAAVFSLDGEIEYYNFGTEMVNQNTARLSFDDPITFQATLL